MRKKIGVIVPIYNTEEYLQECVKSIMNQSYRDLEIMLVDDGSTDGSGVICDELQQEDERVHVIHQENRGILSAAYNALQNMDCEYVTFVDSDDWIDKDAYAIAIPYMEKNMDVISFQIHRVFSDYSRLSRHNYALGVYDKEGIKQNIFPTMIWDIKNDGFGLDPSLCNKIIKRQLMYDELLKARRLHVWYGQDVAVTYPLMKHVNTLVLMADGMYYHRQREGGKAAPYYTDEDYYKKLISLYDYLSEEFMEYPALRRQAEYFYVRSVEYRLGIYGKKTISVKYLFPFDKVPHNSKIILYGASVVGETYYRQIEKINYADIVLWVDKNYRQYQHLGVQEVSQIQNITEYDFVVVAIHSLNIKHYVAHFLIDTYGIDKRKII